MKICPNPAIKTCNAWAIDCVTCPFRVPIVHRKRTAVDLKAEYKAERQYCADAAEVEFGNSM